MRRTIYFGIAAVLAVSAGFLVLKTQHTQAVVVATQDLRVGDQVTSSDVQVKAFHEDSIPSGAVGDVSQVVGQYVALPVTAGEPVLQRAVSSAPSGRSVAREFALPSGFVAVAVPVQPANAVGGMLT